MAVALVTVVSGEVYERYAADMFRSAYDHFHPDPVVAHIMLPGREGWPDATLYRYHVLLENWDTLKGYDYVYLIDADMLFESPVGTEILGFIVATQHPGFVKHPRTWLPYERNPSSTAYVENGERYYCGGFVGGTASEFFLVAKGVVDRIGFDEEIQFVAEWHDESYLNAVFDNVPPSVVLSPSYCFPDDASGYPWLSGMERKIVAVDKTPAERGTR